MNGLEERLESSILAGRAMHAYLITGPDRSITDGLARRAAALMLFGEARTEKLSEDPDYFEYDGSVSIGDFRGVIRPEIYRETFGKNGRVVVFLNAGLLSEMVQNAMLKVLEEPPEKTHFILTGSEYGVLPTIRSRCMVIRCPVPDASAIAAKLAELGADRDEAKVYAAMSGGSAERAERLYVSDEERKLRSGVLTAFIAALKGAPDFKWTKVKRDRTDYIEANELLFLAAHDMLLIKCGLSPEFAPDVAQELKKVCSGLTIGQISGIIDELTECAERLSSNAPGGAAFDRFFAYAASLRL